MRIGLQTWGSNGDILPFISLAGGLSKAGHEVTLAYTSVDHKDYSHFGETLNFKTINAYGQFDTTRSLYELTRSVIPITQLSVLLDHYYDPAVEGMYATSNVLCAENELVIGHVLCHTLLTASQKRSCPRLTMWPGPMVIETKYQAPSGINLGTWVNAMVWKVGDLFMTRTCFMAAKQLRSREGLPPVKSIQKELFRSDICTLIGASQHLCVPHPDWAEKVRICGFLQVPENNANWEISSELSEFMGSGEPPVYMTFGSYTQFDPENTARLFSEAIRLTGKRGIIETYRGISPPKIADPNIFITGCVPYTQVFPKCAMVVHHGGAGTAQSTLLAGKPSVIVEHGFDQPLWGRLFYRKGVSAKLLHRRSVDPEKLARAIQAVAGSSAIQANAAALGAKMRQEDGVKRAVEIVGGLVPRIS